LNEKSPEAHDVPYGNGVSNISCHPDRAQAARFGGNVSIEYEYNWDESVFDAAQCVGFVRGFGSKYKYLDFVAYDDRRKSN